MKRNFFAKPAFLLMMIALLGAGCCAFLAAPDKQNERMCEGEAASVLGALIPDWQIELDGGTMQVPVVLDDDITIVVDRHGIPARIPAIFAPTIRDRIIGLSTTTGNITWVFQPPDLLDNPIRDVSISSRNVAVEYRNKMVILSARTGEVLAQYPMVALDFLVTPFHLYFRDWDRATNVLSLESGKEILEIPPTTVDASKQFFNDDGIVYSLYGNELRIYQDEPFESLSSVILLQEGNLKLDPNNFAVFGQYIAMAFNNMDSTLSLYQRQGNELRKLWDYDQETISVRLWPPVAIGDELFFYLENGSLVRVSIPDGHILSRTAIPVDAKPISAPIAYQDHIYAVYSDGTLRSFTVSGMSETLEVKNNKVRFYGNEGYYWHLPGVVAENDQLLVSFGCKMLYAFHILDEDSIPR